MYHRNSRLSRRQRHRPLFRFEQASGVLMLAAMLLALAVANSPLAELYRLIHHLPVHLRFGALVIDRPLVQWINEWLMVFFFLVVGLEIKRQLLEGHLSTVKGAALPAFAALGGMIAPAAVYVAVNRGRAELLSGWAIPTATDIVLALGVLSLLGPRVPASLRVFLTALAVFATWARCWSSVSSTERAPRLFLGKQMGVLGAAWVGVRLGLGSLPRGVGWGGLYGAALLAGIGFTMSLFVASLAFTDPEPAASARLAILMGSALSAVTGLVVLHTVLAPRAGPPRPAASSSERRPEVAQRGEGEGTRTRVRD